MVAPVVRRRGVAAFALLVVAAEVAGRSLVARVDERLHVRPLANAGAGYYPFLLVGVKINCVLALAALLARVTRAHAAARAGERLLAAVGNRHPRAAPRLRPELSPRVWLAAFVATSALYLLQANVEAMSLRRVPSLDPWLHGYSLPVYALLAVLVAVAWRLTDWLHDVEEYAERAFAHVRRLLGAWSALGPGRERPADDSAPRRRFGLAFESRPPPSPV
jgi:hypothetical protein